MHRISRYIRFSVLAMLGVALLAAHAQAQPGYHGAVGRNLLLNPDFELDSHAWLYIATWRNSYKSYTKPERQPSDVVPGKGMDGGACLLLGANSFPVRSYCVPIEKGATYTVSMYLKAPEGVESGNVSVLVVDPDWQIPLWKKQGGIGTEWKQYKWTFKWDRDCRQGRAYLNLGSGTGLLVDRVMLTRDADPTYEAPVMMGLVTDHYPYFIQGRDDAKATIRIAPGNLFEGHARVEVVCRDAWEQPVWTREIEATLDQVKDVPIDLPTDRLGNFHMEFTAYQDDSVVGRGVGRYTIMDQPGKFPAAPGKPSLFGICQSIFAWPTWANERYAKIVVDTGPQFNRFFAKCPGDTPHAFPEGFLERQISLVKPAHEAGIDLMGCIQFFPGTMQCGKTAEMLTETELASYESSVKAYVTALSPYIKYWEIFNEPNLWRDTSGRKRAFSPEKYFQVQKAAYRAIKSVDPDLVVVCNALNTMPVRWMDEWWELGGAEHMDFFSFHPYRSHPDQLSETGVYDALVSARELLDKHGGQQVGMINSEQLYGCNLFYDRQSTVEVTRGYYVDTEHELEAASRQVRNLIHHVAAGAVCCPFTFREEFASLGPGRTLLAYDSMPAYNATTRFLVDAGRGQPVSLGEKMRAFVFPNAKGGVLAAVWTPESDVRGTMQLEGAYQVFDMMGNARPEMAASNTLAFGTDPVWVRYKPGVSGDAVREAISNGVVRGISDPLRLDVGITGEKQLSVYLTSLTNQPQSGEVTLTHLPKGWIAKSKTAPFSGLVAGQPQAIPFQLEDMALDIRGTFDVAIKAECAAGAYTKEQTLRPFAADRGAERITVDGDASDWAGITFTTLSDANLSTNFDASQSRRGDADLSAKVALAWSEEALAFIAIVTDDKHVVEPQVMHGYRGDSVQLYFDQHNNATDGEYHTADDISYLLLADGERGVAWISKGAEGNFKGAANQLENLADPEAKIAVRRAGHTTIYELVLPREECLPGVRLEAGGGFGFSLLINDNDGKGRKVGLTLAPKGAEPYGHPHEYRDLILREKAK